jgi:amino acid transporter
VILIHSNSIELLKNENRRGIIDNRLIPIALNMGLTVTGMLYMTGAVVVIAHRSWKD